jgi:hypothetical protein
MIDNDKKDLHLHNPFCFHFLLISPPMIELQSCHGYDFRPPVEHFNKRPENRVVAPSTLLSKIFLFKYNLIP